MKLDPKIRDRMARLKAMAEDCANENEAMIAARRLHALEAKHGVSMDDIAYSDLEIGEHGVDISRSVGGGVWVHWIASAVSELYFCSCYIDSGRAKSKGAALSVILVGADRHRDIASAMVNSVISAVARQAKAESKANRPKGEDPWAFITSFRKAAAERISVRCNLMVAEARRGALADEEGGYLPVMADKYDRMALEV